MKLIDKLEAKRAMEKADWECWKKLEEEGEQIHGPFNLMSPRRKDKTHMEC
jgi:hypothetical protein